MFKASLMGVPCIQVGFESILLICSFRFINRKAVMTLIYDDVKSTHLRGETVAVFTCK